MDLPICVKCRKRLSAFITKIEECEAVVDGKIMNWTAPYAYCQDCGSMVWLQEYDEMYITEFEKAIKEVKK